MAWQCLLESQDVGIGKSRVWMVHVGDEQLTGVYVDDRVGSNMGRAIPVVLH